MSEAQSAQSSTESGPGVQFPPPLLFIIMGGLGHLIERLVRSPGHALMRDISPLGWILLGLGIALLYWAMVTFRRGRAAIYPNQRAARMIRTGPYRFSRNPMYVALAIMQTGIGILAANLWILLLVPVALGIVYLMVVRREETYLNDEFGNDYREFCESVRRWI